MSKGRVGRDVISLYESTERTDLYIRNDDFEAIWLEIKNNKSKNIICGYIYRHPRSDMKDFLSYIEKCLLMLNN